MIESVMQNYVDHVSYDSLKSCLVSPSCIKEVTTSKLEFMHSIIEHSEVMEANGWAPKFENYHQVRTEHYLRKRNHLSLS